MKVFCAILAASGLMAVAPEFAVGLGTFVALVLGAWHLFDGCERFGHRRGMAMLRKFKKD